MYSVLLTAMMTTGATTPDFGGSLFGGGCQGCYGCSGCCGGCYGCSGCCGGCYGCSGCCGGCYGCSGCCGGGFLGLGLFSSNRSSSCYGCSGCCGGCNGGCYGGCNGCYGMAFGYASGYATAPIHFGLPGPSPMMPGLGEAVTPGMPAVAPPAGPPNETLPPAAVGEAISTPNQATVLVTLPVDAKLFVDGQPIEQTGAVRTIRTPPLEAGKSYYYVLSIELVRNGKTVKNEERVALEAGKVARVTFPEPGPGGGNTASIDIRIPEGATLTVDGRAVTVQDRRTVVRTPELAAGRDHTYVLAVELTRQGQKHTMSREVRFQAGQRLTVEFDEPTQGRSDSK